VVGLPRFHRVHHRSRVVPKLALSYYLHLTSVAPRSSPCYSAPDCYCQRDSAELGKPGRPSTSPACSMTSSPEPSTSSPTTPTSTPATATTAPSASSGPHHQMARTRPVTIYSSGATCTINSADTWRIVHVRSVSSSIQHWKVKSNSHRNCFVPSN
jgi:hypothetical protein